MFIFIIILSAVVQGLVALFVLSKNPKKLTNIFFFTLSLFLMSWAVINFIITNNPFSQTQLLLYRLLMAAVVAQNSFLFLFAFTYPGSRILLSKNKRNMYIGLSIFAAIAALSPYLFVNVQYGSAGARPVPGPGMVIFASHAAISVLFGLIIIAKRYKNARGNSKAQFKLIFISLFLFYGVVPLTNFVIPLATKTLFFSRVSPIYTLAFSSIIAYAIVRQRLFDIRAAVAKSVAYTLLIGTMAVTYGVAIFASTRLIFPGSISSIAQSATYTALAIVLALTFQPLRRFFERITDNIFFRDRYDAQTVLDNLSKILVTENELGEILHKSLAQLCSEMSISFGQIIIFNNDAVYRMEHFGKLPQRLIVAPQLRKLNHPIIVADELDDGERKNIMDEHGIRVSAILRTREELVGYLLLGDKLSGQIYSRDDVELLQIITKELAVAAQNAKAYAEIQAFNITLQERVAHATSRLRIANRHLKELDQAKDEFISMASHQLRTPLTTIKGYLSMMLEGDAGEITPTQKQFTGYAFEGADRMVNLIADLLNVSRLSAGRFMIEARPSDLGKIVEDEVRQLQSHAVAKKLELVYHAPKRALPVISLDDNKTRQVIMNFIDNAIYYTKEGTITVAVTKVDSAIRVTVRDTGIGVPLGARHKLFSKFYRAENAQTVRPDGTGLGLYLAKRVIEDQGGTIIFESVEGKGSTFGFELPLAVTPAEKPVTEKVLTR